VGCPSGPARLPAEPTQSPAPMIARRERWMGLPSAGRVHLRCGTLSLTHRRSGTEASTASIKPLVDTVMSWLCSAALVITETRLRNLLEGGARQVRRCVCGHDRHAHQHYRRGSDCALCDCTRWRPRQSLIRRLGRRRSDLSDDFDAASVHSASPITRKLRQVLQPGTTLVQYSPAVAKRIPSRGSLLKMAVRGVSAGPDCSVSRGREGVLATS
jgi:hypothetical protein